MNTIEAIIIAIIEGLTEYLPVSSTAHMIFTSTLFGVQEDEFVKMFQVSIQGAGRPSSNTKHVPSHHPVAIDRAQGLRRMDLYR